jgi:hypothetical protein
VRLEELGKLTATVHYSTVQIPIEKPVQITFTSIWIRFGLTSLLQLTECNEVFQKMRIVLELF